jgi:hypothetical protein
MRTQIDKRLEGKGDLKEKENLMKLAKDKADIMFDFENEIVDILRSEYNKEKKKGQSFIDWLDSKPIEYIKNIPLSLAEGGKVISLTDYLKQREKPKIKKIDLDSVAPGKAIADLTDAERKVVNTLLRLTFGGDE